MRCIRCKKEVYCRGDFRGWLVVTVDGVRKVVENDMHNIGFFDEAKNMIWVKHDFIGLCPDCQIERSLIVSPPKKDDVGIDVEKILQTHEMNLLDIGARLLNVEEGMSDKAYNNLLGCLTTIEKRTAKLEREAERHEKVIQQNEANRRASLNAMHDALLSRFDTRILKLEREMDRVWEVIRCKGEK